MHLMLEYADRTLVVSDGQILAQASPIEVLTNADWIAEASLKQTSLFDLATLSDLPDYMDFIRKFIDHDRKEVADHVN
jgi:energy-coupling factor transport system ATP-binding protein